MGNAADSFIRGFHMMDQVENNRIDQERKDSEYKYLQDQRKFGQTANALEYLKSTYGDDHEAMLADPAFKGIVNNSDLGKQFVSADGNQFKLSGFRKNPKSGALVAYGNTVDADGNIVKENVPITQNRTGNPDDPIVELTATDWLKATDGQLTKWEGYREYNQQRQERNARDEFASAYGENLQAQNQAPSTPFQAPSGTVASNPEAAPPTTPAPAPAAPATVPSAAPATFDPEARLQDINGGDGKNVFQKASDWHKDAGTKNIVSKFELMADPSNKSPHARAELQQIAARPDEYASMFVKNADAIGNKLGPEKFEQIRSYLAGKVKPDSEPAKKLSEVANWLPGRKHIKEGGSTLNRDLAALQKKLPEGEKKGIADTSEKTQKALTSAQRQAPKTPEATQQAYTEGKSAMKSISNVKPGARVPTKLKKAALKLWAMNPQAMPLETVDRLITTGRLTKRDIQMVKSGDDVIGFENGQVVSVYKGTPSASDMTKTMAAYRKQLSAEAKTRYDRNTDFISTKSQAVFDQGKLDKNLYPSSESVEAEFLSTLHNNADKLAKAGFPDKIEAMSEGHVNVLYNQFLEKRSGDREGGWISRARDTQQEIDLQAAPSGMYKASNGKLYDMAQVAERLKAGNTQVTTMEEAVQILEKTLK